MPPILEVAFLIGNHLPDAGGVFDQKYGLMNKLQGALSVYRVVQKFRTLVGDDINTKLSAGERMLLGNLYDMGVLR